MARNEQNPEQLESIAKELLEASEALSASAELMRSNRMPHALIHGSTTFNRHLPAVLEWVNKTTSEVKTQLRAYMLGVQSNAEILKNLNERQKAAAAKKPWRKKTAKKKAE